MTDTVYAALADRLLVARGDRPPGVADWTATERLVGHDCECVAASADRPDRAFAGTADSGVQRTTDGGDTFESVARFGDRVTALAVDPSDPDLVWAGTEPSAAYRSTDGGDSWEPLTGLTELPSAPEWSFPPRPDTHHVRWIEPDPRDSDRLSVAIEAGALVRTTDGGDSWQDRPAGAPRDAHTLATHPDRPGRVYAAAGDGYAQSPDGGETWSYPQSGLDHRYVWSLAVPEADPGTVVVSAAGGSRTAHFPDAARSYVYRTAGADRAGDEPRWHRAMDGLPDPERTVRPLLAAAGGSALYALSNRGLFVSTDAGASWERVPAAWPEAYERLVPHGLAVV